MLEGMVPYFKRALIVAVLFYTFFAVAQIALAGSVFPPSGPPPGFDPTPSLPNNPTPDTEPPIYPGTGGGTGGGGGDSGQVGGGGQTPGTSQTTETPPVIVQDAPSCWSSPQGFFHCIMVSFFGTFVAIAGYAFDWSIQLFITRFGEMYITYGVGAVVEGVWGTVRDIFNLTFIFGLVYIGFQIILGINESSAKRTIPLLVVAALLVNFSLFIVKFIIDFANLAALQIYNLFRVAGTLTEGGGQQSPGTLLDILGGSTPSISLAFINTIGVTSLLSHNPSAGSADGVPLFYTFGMIVVFLVLIYVFFAAAILITIRFAALTFYMIFSPIMFLGWVFPGMKSYSDKFWNGLFGQAFFAPALLFMLYITYQLSSGLDGPRRVDGSVFQDEANVMGFAQFVPYLVLIVVFLMASLIVAKKMANQGASMVGKVNDWAVSKAGLAAGGMTAGLVARAGRNTVGAGAYAVQNSEGFKKLTANMGRSGKMLYSGMGKVADSSFDGRKVGGLGKSLGVGEGRKGGFATILKENKESDEKFLKALGTRSFDDYAPEAKILKDSQNKLKNLQQEIEIAKVSAPGDVKFLQMRMAETEREVVARQKAYNEAKDKWSAEEEYKNQLSYIKTLERWQKVQMGGAAGLAAGAGILATGGLGLAPVLTGAGAAAIGRGAWYNSKKEAAALRKEYGEDGSKKKKKDSEEKKLKAALAAAGYKEPEDHGKKDKAKDDHGKKDDHNSTPKAAAPTPKAAPSGGDGHGHDDHGHGGGGGHH